MSRSEMIKFLRSLSSDESSLVLKGLLDGNPELLKKAYDCAIIAAAAVDADRIGSEVFSSLDSLDYGDLNGRAGRTRYGYTEPDEAAWELFEEKLSPFIDEMVKNRDRALPAVAKEYCIGIIKGLLMFEKGSTSDLKGWLQDAPGEYIDTVVEEWAKGHPGSEDIAEVMRVVNGRSP